MTQGDEERAWPFRESAPPLRPPRDFDAEPRFEPETSIGPAAEPAAVQEPAEVETPPPFEQAPEPEQVTEPPATSELQLESEPAGAVLLPEPEPVETDEPVEEELAAAEHAAGEFFVPDGYKVLEGAPVGGRRSVGVVVSRFNGEITNGLLASALEELEEAGVSRDAIVVMPVPGAFELPIAAMALAKTRRYACIVALGCVIRGETPHFDFVAGEAASGLQLAAIDTGVPIAFGLLTCDNREQAEARVGRGADAVRTALEMADLFARVRATAVAAEGG